MHKNQSIFARTSSIMFFIPICAALPIFGSQTLPPLEAVIAIDLKFAGQCCLHNPKVTQARLSGSFPQLHLKASIETSRSFKDNLDTCEELVRYWSSLCILLPSLQ